jgi:hypothetical protein
VETGRNSPTTAGSRREKSHGSRILACLAKNMSPGLEITVSLLYPNGRTHQATIKRDGPLETGEEFVLYGHRWQATERCKPRGRSSLLNDSPLVCRSVATRND